MSWSQHALHYTKWYENNLKDKELQILNDILYNGDNAKGIVKIPKNIKYILPGAFLNSKATSIIIDKNVQEIGTNCFGTNVKSLTIPKTVTKFNGIFVTPSTHLKIQKNSTIDILLKEDSWTGLITYY